MSDANRKLQTLLNQSCWVDAVCDCNDVAVKRVALYMCATSVLPYWESRFHNDESMARVVDCMSTVVKSPSTEHEMELCAVIPKRVRRHWDLSPAPGFPELNYSDCPADFAGDSIFYAAHAFVNEAMHDSDEKSSFDTAIECVARILVERDGNHDDNTDYHLLASNHLRNTILNAMAKSAR